jgi:hypothetical protein
MRVKPTAERCSLIADSLPLKAILFFVAASLAAAEWSAPVEVRQDVNRCVTYRAGWFGGFLVVQVDHDKPWHTYAMDNQRRANEKLAGKKALGIDRPTEITVTGGLETAGPWFQSPPQDLSKPALRWYSWGFDGQTLFAAKARRAGAGPARVAIRGQACTASSCKEIDVELSVPLAGPAQDLAGIDLGSLVQVRH